VISRQVEKESGRSSAGMDHDKTTANCFNGELRKLQGQLDEYHLAFNKAVLGANKDEVIREAKELKEFNEREELEMQRIFQKREQAEKKLAELNKEIESKRNVAEKLLGDMSPELRSKCDELIKQRADLQKDMNTLQRQQSQLFEEKTKLQEKIAASPVSTIPWPTNKFCYWKAHAFYFAR
jgi:chromosome segregation ATPase